ncbi:ead/Ea22-like family protein [Enterobacter sp. 166D1]|uniref:ead/Ea22-like family protein n=1 Tax=Enterobacter TaxID=547 RepID=UPI002A7EB17A|nr:ead/Ea22-like family protein [Enterobacter sp. 166D1]
MSNIDKQALREAAEKALNARARLALMESVFDDDGDDVKPEAQEDISICVSFNELTNPATVLALLDELEAKDKLIAELSHHLQCAHGFIEHTEAFGHEASNGILCCGDAQWNIDESKSALAAAGKGE